jgi:uncharacterized membrane protein YfcA
VSPLQAVLGVLVGFAAGVLSGLFGVGGGIITTPAVNVLLGGTAIQAVATPLPVIFPTSLAGASAYARAGQVGWRAARFVNAHLLLVVTALLMGWTAVQVVRGRPPKTPWEAGQTAGWKYALIGAAAGFVSGLLGVGGGIIMVPAYAVVIGMPLRRALGTSLVVITALVVPGTLEHWRLGHIDWTIFLVLVLGVLPGARLGARIALGVAERTLRMAVGLFLLAVAILYGTREIVALVETAG